MLAAENDVDDEPLSEEFSGILGLALPLNSIISQKVPAGTSNKADGAAWASNLFSITPVSEAPRSRFLSLFLARPGSIASYPPAPTVSDHPVSLFWKAQVREITVYINGERHTVDVGRGAMGAIFPAQ